MLLNHVWMRQICPLVLPTASPALCANLLSALFGAGATALVQATTAMLAGGKAAAGVAAAAVFGLTRLQWMYSIQGEVFALNNLLVAALLWLFVQFEAKPTTHYAVVGAFMCGFALTNQLTAVLYIVGIVPWVLYRLRQNHMLSGLLVAILVVAFFVGFSPYIFLPYSAWQNTARLTWGLFYEGTSCKL